MKSTRTGNRQKPARTARELLLEARLTKTKFLVVEGPADRRFFLQWAKGSAAKVPLDVICISDVEVDVDSMLRSGLNNGNRSMVIFLAQNLRDGAEYVRCIADLDCGLYVDKFGSPALTWTDFPALESYAFSPSVLDTLNRTFLSQRIPSGDVLLNELGEIFRSLFIVRLNNPHLKTPSIEKGFGKGSAGATSFDVKKTVAPETAAKIDSYPDVEFVDVREIVYGHDLAGVLMAIYGNSIKNQCGLKDIEALENSIRASILIEGSISELPLFQEIRDWCQLASL